MNNNYALFYKKDEIDNWHSKRLDLPIEQWKKYCKEQGFFKYDIKDLKKYDALQLHLLTDVVYFNEKYYLSEELIPYPDNNSYKSEIFSLETCIDEDYLDDIESTYEEVYRKQTITWGWGYLGTEINTKLIFPSNIIELCLTAQEIVKYLPEFLTDLRKNSQAVYINMEISKFKWLAWIKGDKIRLIHQDYWEECPKIEFDILVDKDWFFDCCKNMIDKMKEYSMQDEANCKKYIKEHFN